MNSRKEYALLKKDKPLFAIFPYLKTSRRISLCGIEFRRSQDLEGLSDETRKDVVDLSNVFYLQTGVKIRDMVFAVTEENPGVPISSLERLKNAQTFITYVYATPDRQSRVFLPAEVSSCFVFQPDSVPSLLVYPNADEFRGRLDVTSVQSTTQPTLPGYCGLRNWRTPIWIVGDSHIYPEIPHIPLNHSQTVAGNVEEFLSHPESWAYAEIFVRLRRPESEAIARALAAMEWYNSACRAAVTEPEEILHLAIAFESLLRIGESPDNIRSRLELAISTLVGPVPRLETWIHQFYSARSQVVHEGALRDGRFNPMNSTANSKKQGLTLAHRPLFEYGLKIFRLCLTSFLAGAMLAKSRDLAADFVHNTERLQQICAVLNKKDMPPQERILAVRPKVFELDDHRDFSVYPGEVEAAVGAGRLMLEALRDCSGLDRDVSDSAGSVLTSTAPEDTEDLLKKFQDVKNAIRKVYILVQDRSPIGQLADVVYVYLQHATQPMYFVVSYKPPGRPAK
jgi:Apea-like HEPN